MNERDPFHNHILHLLGNSIGWESISLHTAGKVSVTTAFDKDCQNCSFWKTHGRGWAKPGNQGQLARGDPGMGHKASALLVGSWGSPQSYIHVSWNKREAEEPENTTCVISWEASLWFCIPLAFPFLWKHIFPRENWHWKTSSGSVVLQKTKGIKGKWKSCYHLLSGDALIRRGSSSHFGST